MTTLFSPNPNPNQQSLLMQFRASILNWVFGATAVISVLYLIPWGLGRMSHPLLPWDGLFLLGLSIVCFGFSRLPKIGVPFSAAIFIAGFSQPFFYATQTFGINSPATAVFVLSIILCGLLVGGWFLTLWTGFHCLWVVAQAIFELNGRYTPPNAIQTVPEAIASIAFWCTLLITVGLLIRFIIRQLERALQVANGQAVTLNRTLNALVAQSDIGSFLEEAMLAIGEQIGTEGISVFFYEAEIDELRPFLFYSAGKVVKPNEVQIPAFPAKSLPIWQTLRQQKKPLIIDDIANDSRLQLKARLIAEGVKKILYVPLLKNDAVIGWISFNSTNSAPFWPEDVELAALLAKQITLGMQLNDLTEKATQQAGETAVVEERNRMAREIHDTLAQGFTGIVVQLEAAEDVLTEEPEAAQTHLNRARTLAKESLVEARRSVQNLRPQALEQHDLPTALKQTLNKLTPGTLVQSDVKIIGAQKPLPANTEAELLRIMQEAATNALKHAKPSKIVVSLDYSAEDRFTMRIDDNGRGFDPSQPTAGFGLTSMRERAMKINGRINVNMRIEGGTEVVCVIPMPKSGK